MYNMLENKVYIWKIKKRYACKKKQNMKCKLHHICINPNMKNDRDVIYDYSGLLLDTHCLLCPYFRASHRCNIWPKGCCDHLRITHATYIYLLVSLHHCFSCIINTYAMQYYGILFSLNVNHRLQIEIKGARVKQRIYIIFEIYRIYRGTNHNMVTKTTHSIICYSRD